MTDTHSPPPNQPESTPLVRTRDGRVVAGVASGIAAKTDVPLWLIRVAFVVLAFTAGIGLVLYAAGWLLIPDENDSEPIASGLVERIDGTAGWIGVALIGLASLIVLDRFDIFRGDLAAALVLGVIGVLLYRGDLDASKITSRDRGDDNMNDQDQTPLEPDVSPSAGASGVATAVAAPPAPPAKPQAPRPPRPPRETSNLGVLTFAAGLIILGVIGVFDAALSTFDPTPRHYWSAALAITGIGLLVGTVLGRARGLIALGVVLIPIVFFSPLTELDVAGTVGERRVSPDTVAEIDAEYDLGIGSLTIDLRGVDFNGETVETSVDIGIGELVVLIPPNVEVSASSDGGIGELQVLGRSTAGLGLSADRSVDGNNGVLILNTDMGIGSTTVRVSEATRVPPLPNPPDRVLRPLVLDSDYDLESGAWVLDLQNVIIDADGSTSDISLDQGTLVVDLPDDIGIAIETQVGEGVLSFLGDERAGTGLTDTHIINPELGIDLQLEIQVGSGAVFITKGNS